MIFGQDRNELRKMYVDAWQKRRSGNVLSPLEDQIANVIEQHPEYHAALTGEDLDKDYTVAGGQANPYLHMGLHLGIREQLASSRPAGINAIFKALAARTGDAHAAEHQMIECLAETLWESQSQNKPPDEQAYLERLKRL
ncbi:MAG: DUF1841 family protein [Woeseiaceae bacterium]